MSSLDHFVQFAYVERKEGDSLVVSITDLDTLHVDLLFVPRELKLGQRLLGHRLLLGVEVVDLDALLAKLSELLHDGIVESLCVVHEVLKSSLGLTVHHFDVVHDLANLTQLTYDVPVYCNPSSLFNFWSLYHFLCRGLVIRLCLAYVRLQT